ERRLASRGEGEMRLAPVGVGSRARDEPAPGEALEDAAQVPDVDVQGLREIDGGRRRRARRPGVAVTPDLVEHAPLGQREGAVQELFLQYADLARVEAVEAADGVDVLRERRSGHVRSSFDVGPEAASCVSLDPIVD